MVERQADTDWESASAGNRNGAIQIAGLNKWFGAFHVLKNINLAVRKGEKIVICGPSGSGKSTLIRCINRLETHQDGRIVVDGTELTNDLRQIDKVRAEVGMVFQSFNLFPHLTVLRNVTLGPTIVKGIAADVAEKLAHEALIKVGLEEKIGAWADELSGGQQQRVAIARSLAMSPTIMLFDEITSALDPELVGEVLLVLEAMARDGMTMLLVTHEMNFARRVANRVVFMNQGKVWEQGPAKEFFAAPKTEELRSFLNSVLH